MMSLDKHFIFTLKSDGRSSGLKSKMYRPFRLINNIILKVYSLDIQYIAIIKCKIESIMSLIHTTK